jgi:hypothetical protein
VERVANSGSVTVYRLPNALPRARIESRARVVPTIAEVRRLTLAGEIDPRREVLLHDPEAGQVVTALERLGSDGAAAGTARIVVDRATEVAIDADAPRGGLLVLADTYYPGWEADLDGSPRPILRANIAHRAVFLPPGTHRVTFVYRPRSVISGAMLTIVGLMVVLLSLLLTRRPGYRRG